MVSDFLTFKIAVSRRARGEKTNGIGDKKAERRKLDVYRNIMDDSFLRNGEPCS